ncbi:DUF6458 family protein [uncultured Tessaracoccus sp.]|uniref:DUF6458 family protein n=1 Tax=uncultured Tessaracoccus sp. TaxID=905023 RepID=UPI0025ED8DDA|nr:DUF6458 family protein [uncultured Tessaracoccus sp.]
MTYVNIGGPVALGILGAILALAVGGSVAGVDLEMVGYILLVGAVIWLVLGVVLNRRRAVRTTQATTLTDQGHVVDRETYR